MKTFTLSAKSIKKYTSFQLNYELTSNAFDLLNEHIKLSGETAVDINGWLMRVLDGAKEINKKVIKRKDIESIILNLSENEGAVNIVESESDLVSVNEDEDEEGVVIVVLDDHKENLEDIQNDSKDLIVDINDILPETVSTTVEITQLPSINQSETIKELEDEIERLKKIIQIILNKQALLA